MCVNHIVTWPLCGSSTCLRVARCWHLKADIVEHLAKEKLTIDGGVFQDDLKKLKTLLALDFDGLSYAASDDSYTAKRTSSVFRLLMSLKDFKAFLHTDETHRVDGIDLTMLLDSILTGLRKNKVCTS